MKDPSLDDLRRRLYCPNCDGQLMDLESLLSPKAITDPQEMPAVEWCPECGSLVDQSGEENRAIVPRRGINRDNQPR